MESAAQRSIAEAFQTKLKAASMEKMTVLKFIEA
jgi:hypothetical protein